MCCHQEKLYICTVKCEYLMKKDCTNAMKAVMRMMLLVPLMLCQMMMVSAAELSNAANENADSAKLVITGRAAYQWVGEHLDSLANSYLMKGGNILDPDDVREELKSIGYNGLNVTDYIMASRQIDSLVLMRLIDRAEAEGNRTVFFMMGPTAAGKSTALRNNPKLKEMASKAGLVYDGAFISIPSFESRLKMVQDRGFKASIVYVHNDPETVKSRHEPLLLCVLLSAFPRPHRLFAESASRGHALLPGQQSQQRWRASQHRGGQDMGL